MVTVVQRNVPRRLTRSVMVVVAVGVGVGDRWIHALLDLLLLTPVAPKLSGIRVKTDGDLEAREPWSQALAIQGKDI